MTKDEALKLALEALENHAPLTGKNAITALREALVEQPAKQDIPDLIAGTLGVSRGTAYDLMREALQEVQQELVCIGYWNQKTGAYYKPDQISAAHKKLIEDGILRLCYTSPPAQRKPLTDEGIQTIAFEAVKDNWDWLRFARAIEAAHGITEKGQP